MTSNDHRLYVCTSWFHSLTGGKRNSCLGGQMATTPAGAGERWTGYSGTDSGRVCALRLVKQSIWTQIRLSFVCCAALMLAGFSLRHCALCCCCCCCCVPRWFYLFMTFFFVSSGVKCSEAQQRTAVVYPDVIMALDRTNGVDCQFGPEDLASSRCSIHLFNHLYLCLSKIISNASANTSEEIFSAAEKFFGPNVSSLQSEQGLIMRLSHWQSTVINS